MKRFCTLVACLFIFGCLPTSKVILNPDYTNQDRNNKTLAIIVPDFFQIAYRGNVKREFGEGDQNKLIHNFFVEKLPEVIVDKTYIENAFVDKASNSPQWRDTTLEVGNTPVSSDRFGSGMGNYASESATIKFPSEGFTFTLESQKEADLVLILDNVCIWTYYEQQAMAPTMSATGQMTGGGSSSKKSLMYASHFVLWDNKEKKRVSLGKVEAASSGLFNMITMTNWEGVTKNYVRQLFSKTPFIKAQSSSSSSGY